MYDVHIEVESLVYIYVHMGSRTIFFPVSFHAFFPHLFNYVVIIFLRVRHLISHFFTETREGLNKILDYR